MHYNVPASDGWLATDVTSHNARRYVCAGYLRGGGGVEDESHL